jgi:hypothetical protein
MGYPKLAHHRFPPTEPGAPVQPPCPGLLLVIGVGMSEAQQPRICCQCDLPLIELDAYGERLRGCVGCNNWQALASGEWRHLPDDDITALRGMAARWTKAAQRPDP